MSLADRVKKLQRLDALIPLEWRLPLRFRVQSVVGALEPEIAMLDDLLGDAGTRRTTLDVGANIGIYTYALSRLGMEVHAFEPQATCSAVISAWAATREAVHVHTVGVGAEDGELILHTPLVRNRAVATRASFVTPGAASVRTAVPVVRLDSLELSEVAFVKIDVEGYEMSVLLGARTLLERWRPVLVLEINRGGHSARSFLEVTAFLRGLGYAISYCNEGRLVECDDAWTAPDHVYNFICRA